MSFHSIVQVEFFWGWDDCFLLLVEMIKQILSRLEVSLIFSVSLCSAASMSLILIFPLPFPISNLDRIRLKFRDRDSPVSIFLLWACELNVLIIRSESGRGKSNVHLQRIIDSLHDCKRHFAFNPLPYSFFPYLKDADESEPGIGFDRFLVIFSGRM